LVTPWSPLVVALVARYDHGVPDPSPPDEQIVAAAWYMHARQGLSARQIAAELHVSQSTASNYVRKGRAAEGWLEACNRAEQQADQAARLGVLTACLDGFKPKARHVTEACQLANSIVNIEKRRAALLGLDQPAKLAITQSGPAPQPDPRLVAELAKMYPPPKAEDLARAAQLLADDPDLYDAVRNHMHDDPEAMF
jgi:predicted transcriptional regulator